MTDPDLRDPRLDQAYRELPGDAPPSALDEQIRAAAHRAVGARPQSLAARRRSWASRWRVPLALAASVVVVVTLTLMVQEEEQRALQGEPMLAPPPAAPPALEDRAAPPREAEDARRGDTEPARRAPASAPPQRAPAADAAAPPPPQLQKLETRQPRLEEPAAAQIPSPPTTAPAPAAKPSAAPPLRGSPAAPSGASDSLSRERAVGERPARETRSAPLVARSPEEWLDEIRRLKAQGRDADAAAELAEFRRRHPDYPLPADLAR
jgi:hypothetical protein